MSTKKTLKDQTGEPPQKPKPSTEAIDKQVREWYLTNHNQTHGENRKGIAETAASLGLTEDQLVQSLRRLGYA